MQQVDDGMLNTLCKISIADTKRPNNDETEKAHSRCLNGHSTEAKLEPVTLIMPKIQVCHLKSQEAMPIRMYG